MFFSGPIARHSAARIALGLLVWAFYASSLSGDFVLDNRWILLDDPRIRGLTAENLRAIFTQDYHSPTLVSGLYRPLTTLSYLLNHAVLGNADRPLGYHVVNVLLHWGNALLVHAVVLALKRDFGLAFCAAALFASHPIATEAVTNIVGRADLLAASSVLVGLLLHIRGGSSAGWRRSPWLAGLALSTGAGFLCKENAVAVAASVLLYDLVQRRRADPPAYLAIGLPVLLVGYAKGVLYAGLPLPPPTQFTDNPLVGVDFWTARLTALQVVARYGGLLAWPAKLSCDYSYDQIPLATWRFDGWEDGLAVLALGAIAAMILVAVRRRRANPALAFFIGFMLAALLPTSNLVVLIGSIMAERFLYLPSVGFAACVAILVFGACSRLPVRQPRALAAALLAGLALAGGLRTVARNRDWRDDVRLWSAAVDAAPHSFKTHHGLAYALHRSDEPRHRNIDAVIEASETAIRILDAKPLPPGGEPSSVSLNLGIYYWTKARSGEREPGAREGESRSWDEKALAAFERAAKLDRAENELSRQREVLRGKAPDALANAGDWRIYQQLGLSAWRLGRHPQAIEAFAYLRELVPASGSAYLSLARVQQVAGRPGDAAVTALQALALDPGDQGARALLVGIYAQLDPGGCALVARPGGRAPDADCPRVRADLCSAYTGLAELFENARRDPSAAERWRLAARDHCS